VKLRLFGLVIYFMTLGCGYVSQGLSLQEGVAIHIVG
jgi:hypothetical protein